MRPSDWRYELTAGEVDEINRALETLRATGKALIEMSRADFPLPTLGDKLRQQVALADKGLGIRVIAGIPVGDKTEPDARLISWGLGLHMGVALPQNAKGDVILDVRDASVKGEKSLRGNQSASEIHYHVDSSDIVTLLCRRIASHGGVSRIVSSLAIHNIMARLHPDLLAEMYQPLPFYRLAKLEGESSPFFMCPVFGVRDGHFTSRYYRARILAAAALPDAPRLTERQRRALDVIHELASDPATYLEMNFAVGDMQLVNNHVIYHARTDFEDYDDPDLKRHLFRMWLSIPDSRPLPREFAPAYGNYEPGTVRGGYIGWDFPDTVGKYQERVAQELGLRMQ